MTDELDDEAENAAVESVRVQLARIGEKLKRKVEDRELNTKVQMLHEADQRVFKDALDVIERSTTSVREYVRDRVKESSLETSNALKDMENHLKDHMTIAINAAIAAAVANQPVKGGGINPLLGYGGGTVLVSAIWIIAYALGFKPPGLG